VLLLLGARDGVFADGTRLLHQRHLDAAASKVEKGL
jgi:hypothetical protein